VQQGTPNMYRPTSVSAAGKAVAFFLANPEEELLDSDVSEKFNVARASVEALMTASVSAGYISKRNVSRGVKAYFAGPKIDLLKPAAGAAPADDLVVPTIKDIGMPAAQQAIEKARSTRSVSQHVKDAAAAFAAEQSPTGGCFKPADGIVAFTGTGKKHLIGLRNSKRQPIDLLSLPIRVGVLPPTAMGNTKGVSQWDPLFTITLAKIGNSTVLPLEFAGALRKAVQKRVKEHAERYLVLKGDDEQVAIWRLALDDPRGMGHKPAKAQ
jgi:hypothetical protein